MKAFDGLGDRLSGLNQWPDRVFDLGKAAYGIPGFPKCSFAAVPMAIRLR